MISFTISRVPVGPNSTWEKIAGLTRRVKGLRRMHFQEYRRYRDGWQVEIEATLRSMGFKRALITERKCRVMVTQFRTRLLDEDNLAASCKPILDGLVRCGLLYRDSPKWMALVALQENSPNPKTTITVQEIV